jgi:hypothetical protein
MTNTIYRKEYDWREISLEEILDLMKDRKIAIKTMIVDGDNKKILFTVEYLK